MLPNTPGVRLSGDASHATITATLVSDEARLQFMSRQFALNAIKVEAAIYTWMKKLTEGVYAGGLWEFIELSNGGGYLRPPPGPQRRPDGTVGGYRLCIEGNYFDDIVTADAAGVIVTLFALNNLLWASNQALALPYDRVLEFVAYHPERVLIRAALD